MSEKKKGGKASLAPLIFEEALSGLLQVEPPEKPTEEAHGGVTTRGKTDDENE